MESLSEEEGLGVWNKFGVSGVLKTGGVWIIWVVWIIRVVWVIWVAWIGPGYLDRPGCLIIRNLLFKNPGYPGYRVAWFIQLSGLFHRPGCFGLSAWSKLSGLSAVWTLLLGLSVIGLSGLVHIRAVLDYPG